MKTLILILILGLSGCASMQEHYERNMATGAWAANYPVIMMGIHNMERYSTPETMNPYIRPVHRVTCTQIGVFTNCW